MPSSPNTLVVPPLTESDFAEGRVRWDLFHEISLRLGEGRPIDKMDFSGVTHLEPYAIALVVGLARCLGTESLSIVAPDDVNARHHLVRLGIPAALGVDWGDAPGRSSSVPLEIVHTRPSSDFAYRVTSRLAAEFPAGLPAGTESRIADCVDEVILNALAHAESPIGCVVVGQALPANCTIEVAFLDFGVTILGHLRRRFATLASDEAGIREAVKEGVTGTPPGQTNRLGDPNSGVGLAELREYVEATAGELAILSGSMLVCFGARGSAQPLRGQGFPGTLVNVRFNTAPGDASSRPKGALYYS